MGASESIWASFCNPDRFATALVFIGLIDPQRAFLLWDIYATIDTRRRKWNIAP